MAIIPAWGNKYSPSRLFLIREGSVSENGGGFNVEGVAPALK